MCYQDLPNIEQLRHETKSLIKKYHIGLNKKYQLA